MRRILLGIAIVLIALSASCVPRDCTGFKIDPAKQPPPATLPPPVDPNY